MKNVFIAGVIRIVGWETGVEDALQLGFFMPVNIQDGLR